MAARFVVGFAVVVIAAVGFFMFTDSQSSLDSSGIVVEQPGERRVESPEPLSADPIDVPDVVEVVADDDEPDEVAASEPAKPLPSVGAVVQTTNWMADQLAQGLLTEQDVLDFAEDMLGYLDGVEPTIRDNGNAEYTLIDNDACKVKLTAKGAGNTSNTNEFVLQVDAATQPGRVTGLSNDGTERTRLEMSFNPNDETPNVSTLANAEYKQSRIFLEEIGTDPVPYGGVLTILAEEAHTRQLTIQRSEEESGVGMLHRFTEPEVAPGTLQNPRFGGVFAKLASSKAP